MSLREAFNKKKHFIIDIIVISVINVIREAFNKKKTFYYSVLNMKAVALQE